MHIGTHFGKFRWLYWLNRWAVASVRRLHRTRGAATLRSTSISGQREFSLTSISRQRIKSYTK